MLLECHGMYHGEKVAFGTIVQLVLEDAPTEKLEEVLGFCIELGLPVTMKELGVAELTREQAMIVAEAACAPDDTMCNMPFEVTPEMVANAIQVPTRWATTISWMSKSKLRKGQSRQMALPLLLWCKGIRLLCTNCC